LRDEANYLNEDDEDVERCIKFIAVVSISMAVVIGGVILANLVIGLLGGIE